jgi:CheY-specific phosphatase CheX
MESRHINQHLDSACAWLPTHTSVNTTGKPKNPRPHSNETQAKAWANVFGSASTSKSRLVNKASIPTYRSMTSDVHFSLTGQ